MLRRNSLDNNEQGICSQDKGNARPWHLEVRRSFQDGPNPILPLWTELDRDLTKQRGYFFVQCVSPAAQGLHQQNVNTDFNYPQANSDAVNLQLVSCYLI